MTLSWSTPSKVSSEGFYVQHRGVTSGRTASNKTSHRRFGPRSTDDWISLGFVEGKRGISDTTSYQFDVEKDLRVGQHQFRLQRVDSDGRTVLSEPTSVRVGLTQKVRLTEPAPNPVKKTAQFSFAVENSTDASVTLYNVLGQRVRVLYDGTPSSKESIPLTLNASGLSNGVYVVRLRASGVSTTQKIIVLR